jgi:hypothetical protein
LMTRANSGSGKSDFELARLITGSTFPFPGTERARPGWALPGMEPRNTRKPLRAGFLSRVAVFRGFPCRAKTGEDTP